MLLGVLVLPAAVFCFRPLAPLETHFYVWQRAWTPELREALRRGATRASGFSVYAGDFECGNEGAGFAPVSVAWNALADARIPVTLVFRARECLNTEDPKTVSRLSGAMAETARQARAAGVRVAGLQLDYDCPTSKLGSYARLLSGMREPLKNETLSITALPTWLPDVQFRNLARQTGYYVLQVHSFETPKSVQDAVQVCPAGRVPAYLKRAAAFGVPFYLALPTYGYQVVFNAQGAFAGIRAEAAGRPLPPGAQAREVLANPKEIAGLVRQLSAKHPRALRGLIWFRLPVPSDQHNWTWDTLAQVLDGAAPEARFTAEVRAPENDLCEVWIKSPGGAYAAGSIQITLDVDAAHCLASDLLNHFEEVSRAGSSLVLRGPAPPAGKDLLALWMRFVHNTVDKSSVKIKSVEVIE